MLNELQSSYDELLHKYAAAENALDKVSSFKKMSFDKGFAETSFILSGAIWCGATTWLWRSRRGFFAGRQGGSSNNLSSVFTIFVDIMIIVVIKYVAIVDILIIVVIKYVAILGG